MKTTFKALASLMILTLVTACGNDKDSGSKTAAAVPGPAPVGQTQDFKGKTPDQIMRLKYNRAEFVCNLWVQHGVVFQKAITPNDRYRINLLEKNPLGAEFRMYASHPRGNELIASFYINQFNIDFAGQITGPNGEVYLASYTPIIKVRYSASSRVFQGRGQFSTVTTPRTEVKIGEKIPLVLVNDSSKAPDQRSRHFNYLECVIETDIKPEYQNQFVVRR